MKNKKAKLFTPTFSENKKCTLVSANKIKELVEFLPTEEALQVHMQIQKIQVQKDEKYQPQPLVLKINSSNFNEVFNKIKGKSLDKECIVLVTAWPAIPICLIYSKNNNEK